jgi:sec-independent protein translocase protein TatB
MFDIGWSELVVIGVVALIAIGPKELPGVLRSVGQWTGKIRRMAAEFQGQFQDAMREADMADVKKEVDQLTSSVSQYTNFDPLAETKKQLQAGFEDKPVEPAVADPASPIDVPPIDVPPPEALPATATPAVDAAASAEPAVASGPPKDGG